ncbi:hypothetical protein GCM10020256_00120 [Streptomyces thermocoprophilus]
MTSGNGNTLFDPQTVSTEKLYAQRRQRSRDEADAQEAGGQGKVTAEGLLPDTLSDRGNAKLFVRLYASDYRHVPGLGWFRWDGTRWLLDEDDTVMWAAGDLAESLATTDPRGHFSATALQQHRRRALSTSGMTAMLVQARSAPGMVLNASLLDADPYSLCTPGGVVDLRTGGRSGPPIRTRTSTPGPPLWPRSRCPRPAGTGSSPTPSGTGPKARRWWASCTCCSATRSPGTWAAR